MGIEWLKPSGEEHNYDPHERVKAFIEENGSRAGTILEVFGHINPLNLYFDENVNPDEYISYAERFLKNAQSFGNQPTKEQVKEAVKNSFHEDDVQNGSVSQKDIDRISMIIGLQGYGLPTGDDLETK